MPSSVRMPHGEEMALGSEQSPLPLSHPDALNPWNERFWAVGCPRAVVGQPLILARYAGLMTVIESQFIGKNKLPFYVGRRIIPPLCYIIKFVIFISNAFQKRILTESTIQILNL